MTEIIKLICSGIILGAANIVPGISGGTMALVFGIYSRMIELICFDIKKILSMWKFWLPLGIGIGAGVLFFSKLASLFLETYPVSSYWFFIGIIAGSLPFIAAKTLKETENYKKNKEESAAFCTGKKIFPLSLVIAFSTALILMIVIRFVRIENIREEIFVQNDFLLSVKICMSGIFAAAAMIIPGISGSFLLLIFGTYGILVKAVADLNMILLVPAAAGAAIGLLGGAGLVRLLLKKAPAQTYAAILGLVTGSLIAVYPGLPPQKEIPLSAVLCIAGFGIAYISGWGKKDGPVV